MSVKRLPYLDDDGKIPAEFVPASVDTLNQARGGLLFVAGVGGQKTTAFALQVDPQVVADGATSFDLPLQMPDVDADFEDGITQIRTVVAGTWLVSEYTLGLTIPEGADPSQVFVNSNQNFPRDQAMSAPAMEVGYNEINLLVDTTTPTPRAPLRVLYSSPAPLSWHTYVTNHSGEAVEATMLSIVLKRIA